MVKKIMNFISEFIYEAEMRVIFAVNGLEKCNFLKLKKSCDKYLRYPHKFTVLHPLRQNSRKI